MMNELLNYLILGFVQGVTEFFPISSSGHLVLFEDFLGINNAGASAEIIAHFGTLFSIILFYRATFFSLFWKYYLLHLIYPLFQILELLVLLLIFELWLIQLL